MITLTREERDKFAQWLLQEAKTEKELLEQMALVASPEVIMKRYRTLIAARLVIINEIHGTEEMTL